MSKTTKATIEVQGATITVVPHEGHDFISLTDIAKYKNPDHPDDVVRNWLRNRSTVEFLGIWERLNNPALIPSNSTGFGMQRGNRPGPAMVAAVLRTMHPPPFGP